MFNVLTALTGAITGVMLARLLGPDGRGDYAAITSLFGLGLVIFELGLAASVVFFASRNPQRAGIYAGTSATILVPLALLGSCVIALTGSLVLSESADRTASFLAISVFLGIALMGSPATGSLQAFDIRKWNIVRLIQALTYAGAVAVVAAIGLPSLLLVVLVYGLSVAVQTGSAWAMRSRLNLPRLAVSAQAASSMTKFGARNMASTVPSSLNYRFDQIILATMVPSAALGQYAVAVSLSVLVAPIVVAFGYVAFPAVARGGNVSAFTRRAIRGGFLVAVVGIGLVLVASPVLVPLLFGGGFGDVPRLLLFLAPGVVFFVMNQVVGDLLRGLGRPGLVAAAEWGGVVVTMFGLWLLVPVMGVAGAAATSSVAYLLVHSLLRVFLTRASRAELTLRADSGGRLGEHGAAESPSSNRATS